MIEGNNRIPIHSSLLKMQQTSFLYLVLHL